MTFEWKPSTFKTDDLRILNEDFFQIIIHLVFVTLVKQTKSTVQIPTRITPDKILFLEV